MFDQIFDYCLSYQYMVFSLKQFARMTENARIFKGHLENQLIDKHGMMSHTNVLVSNWQLKKLMIS